MFCTWSVKRPEKRHVLLFFCVRVDVKQAVNCAPWLGYSVVESWPETGLSLSEVTQCYNSHILSVGRRTMLLLPPWFGPRLTFWPINLSWTRSQRITSHWKFGVYQGFDTTRAGWTPCSCRKAGVKLSSWVTVIQPNTRSRWILKHIFTDTSHCYWRILLCESDLSKRKG